MTDGLFVSFEGGDFTGKETQHGMLLDRIAAHRDGQEQDYDVLGLDFPRYDETVAGQVLDDYLDGAYDASVSDEALSLFYAADRYDKKDTIEETLDGGGVVVTDRYAQSNYAYQTADDDETARMAFVDWLRDEVERFLPQPDEVIYLDVPASVSGALMQESDRALDENDMDLAYQEAVRDAYRYLADELDWTVVDCMEDGALRDPGDIHDEVWRVVAPRLPDA